MNESLAIEIEQCLIGCCFHDNTAIARIMEAGLRSDDFLAVQHALLFERILKLFTEHGRFSVMDMAPVLGEFPEGMSASLYARACVDMVPCPTPDQAADYAQSLKEQSRKRTVLAAIKEAENILPSRSSTEVLSYIGELLTEHTSSCRLKTGADVYQEIMAEMELPPEKWSTGIPKLDHSMAGGLYAGFVYGFAGKEKSGKTTLASTISFNLDQSGCKHLYVALEMGSREIEKRNLARRMGENSIKFRKPGDDFKAKAKSAEQSRHVIYLDAPGAALEEILYEISIARMRHGIKGFILDYWQLVTGRERGETEEQHIRRVAQSLADYAKKQGLWCIILAQQNKEGDLFGGGGLKKACEQLYFIETPSKPGQGHLRWLRMEASRYTPVVDVGSEVKPALYLNQKSGPYFSEYTDLSENKNQTGASA